MMMHSFSSTFAVFMPISANVWGPFLGGPTAGVGSGLPTAGDCDGPGPGADAAPGPEF